MEDYIVIVSRQDRTGQDRIVVMIALSLTALPGRTTLTNPNSAYLLLRSDTRGQWWLVGWWDTIYF